MRADRELRELFEAARREDESAAPRFRELLQRDRRKTGELPWIPLAPRFAVSLLAVLLIALAAALLYLPRSGPAPHPSATEAFLSHGRWQAPTDFLLQTPGRELLGSTPRIGAPLPLDYGSSEPMKGTRT